MLAVWGAWPPYAAVSGRSTIDRSSRVGECRPRRSGQTKRGSRRPRKSATSTADVASWSGPGDRLQSARPPGRPRPQTPYRQGARTMEVVILAAGAGRRFGELKQFVPVAPDGATLLEVTLRDARRAGCERAVILVSPGHEPDVRALLHARPIAGLEIAVLAQRVDDLPAAVPVRRDRPWGTAHAAWSVRADVRGPFLLFNADDHYGPGAPTALIDALAAAGGEGPGFALLGYPLAATLSDQGTVSRALCEVDDHRWLRSLREVLAIDADGRIAAGDGRGRILSPDGTYESGPPAHLAVDENVAYTEQIILTCPGYTVDEDVTGNLNGGLAFDIDEAVVDGAVVGVTTETGDAIVWTLHLTPQLPVEGASWSRIKARYHD
ncbi:NTP transferase domain-containing protein [bacterium]|nr:NTP transferase domain-containing protein [bacterium]